MDEVKNLVYKSSGTWVDKTKKINKSVTLEKSKSQTCAPQDYGI